MMVVQSTKRVLCLRYVRLNRQITGRPIDLDKLARVL